MVDPEFEINLAPLIPLICQPIATAIALFHISRIKTIQYKQHLSMNHLDVMFTYRHDHANVLFLGCRLHHTQEKTTYELSRLEYVLTDGLTTLNRVIETGLGEFGMGMFCSREINRCR